MARTSAPRLVGLDIGGSGLRAVEVAWRNKPGAYEIVRAAWEDLDPDIVRNGTVVDAAALTAAIKRLWRHGRFSTRKVAFGMPDAAVLTRQLELPWMPPADFRAALRYQVQDALPISINAAELDYHVLDEVSRTDAAGQRVEMNRILVVAADRTAVEDHARAIRGARLEPVVADSSAFALIRAWCRGVLPQDPAAHAIADIGADQLTVVIHAAGQPRFIRTVANLGGNAATEALAQRLDLAIDDAEALKRRTGLNGPAPVVLAVAESSVFGATGANDVGPIDPTVSTALATLNPWATTIVQELRNSLDYFHSTEPDTELRSLSIAGRTICLDGLVERISTELAYPVKRFDPLLDMPASKRVHAHAPADARFALAAGLAMGARA